MILPVFGEAASLGLPARVVIIVLLFQFLSTLMELAGLVLLLPVFQYIQAAGDLTALTAEHAHWRWLVSGYGVVGLQPTLGSLLLTSFAFLLLRQWLTYWRLCYQAQATERLNAEVRARAFQRYLYADTDYQDGADSGGFVNDLTTDLQRANVYVFASIALIGYAVIFATYAVMLLSLSALMTLTALVVFGIAIFCLRSQMRKSEATGKEAVAANQKMSSFLVERLAQARLVRLSGTERAEATQMAALTERQRDRMVRLQVLLASIDVIVEPIIVGAAFALIFISVTAFGLRIEEIGLFLVIVLRLLPLVKEAAKRRQTKRALKAAYDTVNGSLTAMEEAREGEGGARTFAGFDKELAFEQVVFTYRSRLAAPALDGVTVEVGAREMTALVGPSGAGKSTLFDLIPRLRHPESGAIRFDGVDISDFNLASLRAGIAYVPQSPQVFNVPLAEHIRYGKPDASREEVIEAARMANAAGFIEVLPNGYDTLAGPGGDSLSGGQRQRLDLARALVRRAPLLLLDEPTSNLDAESEALFREALNRIQQEAFFAVLVIAHRLSTVVMADRIIVLKDGRVEAAGTHEELLDAGGWYAEAFVAQAGRAPEPALAVQWR